MANTKKIQDHKGMTNVETARAIGGVVLATGAAAASYADQIEQYLRIGASAVAIASGLVVIWYSRKRYHNKPNE